MITLFEFEASPYCAKVKKVLAFKKLPFEVVEVDFLRRSEPKALSGQSKVPVIKDGGKVVFDSTTISLYLEDVYPDRPILPRDEKERARVRVLEDWSDEGFAWSAIPAKLLPPGNAEILVARSIEKQGSPFVLRALKPLGATVLRSYGSRRRARGRTLSQIQDDFRRDLDLLEAMLAGNAFLALEVVTLADFAVYGFLATMEGVKGFEEVTARPRLSAWFERVRAA
ncbi:MAG: glutathione S-transferase family protein [Acidobacteriota bacterium]